MDPWNPEQNILTNETERKPNRYAANAMATVTVVLVLVWILNELSVFHVDPWLMRGGALLSVVAAAIPLVLSHHPAANVSPVTKYVIMGCAVVCTFIVSVLLNFHVTMALLFPISVAMLYRSRRIGWFAVIGSALCTVLSPVIGYLTGALDVSFIKFLTMIGSGKVS